MVFLRKSKNLNISQVLFDIKELLEILLDVIIELQSLKYYNHKIFIIINKLEVFSDKISIMPGICFKICSGRGGWVGEIRWAQVDTLKP